MKFKNWTDIGISLFISATVLLAIDVIILGVVAVKLMLSDLDEFWPLIYEYFFQSWFVILHFTIILLFMVGFIIFHFLGRQKIK